MPKKSDLTKYRGGVNIYTNKFVFNINFYIFYIGFIFISALSKGDVTYE